MYVRAYDPRAPAGSRMAGEAKMETELELMLQLSVYWTRKELPLVVISQQPVGEKKRAFTVRGRKEA